MVTLICSDIADNHADAHWQAMVGGGVAASCSLWWKQVPALAGERVGLIGHYMDTGPAAAHNLITRALQELSDRGCTLAIGPMDGSTWRSYRFVTEHGARPPFFLEPDNPGEWPAHFVAAGFETCASYTSAITSALELHDERADRVEARLLRQGFLIRPLDPSRFDEELHLLYRISLAGFAENFLYQQIPEEEFYALYRPIQPYVRPNLVLIAEREGEPAAFLFAIPDRDPENFIIKTLAAHPKYAGRGLGTVLIQHVNRAASTLGYRRAIHALMHEENQSTRISARQAEVFRRYALYSRRLAPGSSR